MSNKKVHTSDLIFGASIKSIRKILKLTQNQFAEPLSISGSYVSNIEKGEAMPSEAVIREVCTYYRINRDYLTTGTGDMFVTSSGIGISGGNTEAAQLLLLPPGLLNTKNLPKYYLRKVFCHNSHRMT